MDVFALNEELDIAKYRTDISESSLSAIVPWHSLPVHSLSVKVISVNVSCSYLRSVPYNPLEYHLFQILPAISMLDTVKSPSITRSYSPEVKHA